MKESIKAGCKKALTAIAFLLSYFLFLLFGGYMFLLIEKGNDERLKDSKRKHFLNVLDKYNISIDNAVIKEVVVAAVEASNVNGLILTDYNKTAVSEWNLGSSVFFAGTVVTTIGYGNIHPRTRWGKGFCMLFALFGIPFTGFVLAKMGYGLSNLIKTADTFIENQIKQCFPEASKKENIKSHVRSVQLAFVCLMFILIFLLLPAAALTKTEINLSFFDSFYFCFISLSTIGLGDITPGASEKAINFDNGFQWKTLQTSLHQVSIILYLLTGLAALTIILALVSSIMKAAAEKTLKGGTDLVIGGKLMGSKARRLASNIRSKASMVMNGSKVYNSNPDVVDDDDDATTEIDLKNSQRSSSLSKDACKLPSIDDNNISFEEETDSEKNEAGIDGDPLEVIIENANAVRYYTVDTKGDCASQTSEKSHRSSHESGSPSKAGDSSSMLHESQINDKIKNGSQISLKKLNNKHRSSVEVHLTALPSAHV